eukprot:CAMPEP_0204166944 /NCGR_PEP_ID=MMETSP0361-20130328/39446_1 /ASSEMBLY_ACC=CAM_ASM_000343 /TAXON_ID=268821 /ORGANISM="Scrippsiella Hangoei, Strain SHTV-5" /LENGTH=65 /DNA_ID=CAMNT_0051124169 /DNA_START=17 /DNA_END=211 /DNA_ORIENTATION=+
MHFRRGRMPENIQTTPITTPAKCARGAWGRMSDVELTKGSASMNKSRAELAKVRLLKVQHAWRCS